MFALLDLLSAITGAYPGIQLTAADVQQINAGQIVLVGRGSILTPGPGGLTGGFSPGGLIPKGCIDRLFYGTGSKDLDFIQVDGTSYSPSNLKDFREILEQAAFNMKCINFCLVETTNTMRMLNVYPQCCCRCEEVKT